MKRNSVLSTAQFLLAFIAIFMIAYGSVLGDTFMIAPIVTGIGFLIIAWTLTSLKRSNR
jgi:Flp pilus assembly pilin Flp